MSLQIGDPAPEFALPDQDDNIVRLSDLRGTRVFLYFYPKDDTPGCTAQACGFRDAQPTFDAGGGVVLGVSPDGAASHRKFRKKYDLAFPLLVDADHAVAEAYGAWGDKSMFGKHYQGIMRSLFIIGPDGALEDVRIKVSPADSVALAVAAMAR
ncbi:MAG: thioredoxin-dependent thiol peroxidase [Ardenticatenales bacterium]